MHFYKLKGKLQLDLTGNLVLSHNKEFISAQVSSAGPRRAANASYIMLRGAKFRQRVKATAHALAFIWGKQEPNDK
jgi:hypothetical protein